MNILAVNVLYHPHIGGGAEITIKNLYEGLLERGHVINVLTFNDTSITSENINGVIVHREKIPNVYLPYFIGKKRPNFLKRRLWHLIDIYNIAGKKLIEKYIDIIKPDIVIFHNIPGFSPSVWELPKSKGIPSVQVLHDLYLLCPRNMFKNNKVCIDRCTTCKLMRIPHKNLSNKLSAVVGVSNFIINKYLQYGYFEKVKIREVIYNSRKFKPFEQKRNKLRKYDGTISFGFIGNIAPNKGLEVLLKAYKKIKNKHTRLVIAGSGNIGYVEYLKKNYSDDSIIWLGWVNQDDFFSKVDFTVVPSIWYEALGMIVVESFSYGIPVIGSRIGGIPEMVEENNNGILFEPGNYNELAEKLEDVAKNIIFWKENSDNIIKSAQKFLDYKRWIDKWEELLIRL